MLGYRKESLCIPVNGMILRQGVYFLSDYEEVAKEEWIPLLKSKERYYNAPVLSGKDLDRVTSLLALPINEAANPNNCPILATKERLGRMPPAYFVEPELDPAYDEAILFEKLLREAGVATKLKEYKGVPHEFHAFHISQSARDEMVDTAEGLKWLLQINQ